MWSRRRQKYLYRSRPIHSRDLGKTHFFFALFRSGRPHDRRTNEYRQILFPRWIFFFLFSICSGFCFSLLCSFISSSFLAPIQRSHTFQKQFISKWSNAANDVHSDICSICASAQRSAKKKRSEKNGMITSHIHSQN